MNPFDDPRTRFRVLVNGEGQHSLWPAFARVPAGWLAVFGPAGKADCQSYVDGHWTVMRPRRPAAASAAATDAPVSSS